MGVCECVGGCGCVWEGVRGCGRVWKGVGGVGGCGRAWEGGGGSERVEEHVVECVSGRGLGGPGGSLHKEHWQERRAIDPEQMQ